MIRRAALALCLIALAACAPDPEVPPTTASEPPTLPSSATTAPPSPEPSLIDFTTGDPVALPGPGELGPGWESLLTIGYGDADDQLGTSLGGDGAGIRWGPSYGTQLPDGTWWFIDVAHRRLAHFGETGSYLGDAPIPAEHLAQGQYLQYQRPLALKDGVLVLQSTTPERPGLLRLSPDGGFSRTPLEAFAGLVATDGTRLFGFDEVGLSVAVDPSSGIMTPVDAFDGQVGISYSVRVLPGGLAVTLRDLSMAIPLTAEDHPEAVVYPVVEAVTGVDKVLTLLVKGLVELDGAETDEVVALLRIDETGHGTVESLRSLSSPVDPGDGAHLGIRLGDDRPWLMVIDEDAVRVYRRG